MAFHIFEDGFARQTFNQLGLAQDRSTDGLIRKGGLLKMVEYNIVRRIMGLVYFLDNNSALALQFFRLHRCVLEDV